MPGVKYHIVFVLFFSLCINELFCLLRTVVPALTSLAMTPYLDKQVSYFNTKDESFSTQTIQFSEGLNHTPVTLSSAYSYLYGHNSLPEISWVLMELGIKNLH